MAQIALVFGYGQKANGGLVPQTIARCDKAAEIYRQGSVEILYMTCAVYSANKVSMCEKMKDRLVEQGVPDSAIRIVPRGTNTAGEIDTFLKNISSNDTIIAISSTYHLPRIWFLFLTRGVLPKLAGTMDHTNRGDILLEPVKFLNAILRPFSWSKTV